MNKADKGKGMDKDKDTDKDKRDKAEGEAKETVTDKLTAEYIIPRLPKRSPTRDILILKQGYCLAFSTALFVFCVILGSALAWLIIKVIVKLTVNQ